MEKEIKKAWETMKKELAKETGISGGFAMNSKQIKNCTATYLSTSARPYDWWLDYAAKEDAKVQGYDSWTAEEKAASHERYLAHKAEIESKKTKYGTPEKKVLTDIETIRNSNAFKKFADFVGGVNISWEQQGWAYVVRFDY